MTEGQEGREDSEGSPGREKAEVGQKESKEGRQSKCRLTGLCAVPRYWEAVPEAASFGVHIVPWLQLHLIGSTPFTISFLSLICALIPRWQALARGSWNREVNIQGFCLSL